tara:strand:+ start:3821 stop:4666 length:846 start_codon:yes stop_codon:yes gene_type:complete
MVVKWHGGKVGISELVISHIGTIDLELELVTSSAHHGDIGGITGGDVLDRVVEVELLNLGVGSDRLLHLGHDHVLGLRSENFTLLSIKVRVVRVDLPLTRSSLNTPRDAELHIVVLQGDEGKGRLPVLTERKPQRVELRSAGPVVQTGRRRLGRGERRKGGGDESRVSRVLFIDHLTTDKQFDLRDHIRPVSREGVRRKTVTFDGHEVNIVEEIPLALEADGGHTVVRDIALNDLTLDSLGKVCVTLVGRPEKADFGLTDKVDILGTDSNKLGNTARHFII